MAVNAPQQPAPREFTTTSRLWAWYMVQFRGFIVAQHREIPKVTRLGRLTYEQSWLLRASAAGTCGKASEPLG